MVLPRQRRCRVENQFDRLLLISRTLVSIRERDFRISRFASAPEADVKDLLEQVMFGSALRFSSGVNQDGQSADLQSLG